MNCPFSVQERPESVDWLLGLAVRFEYGDNGMIIYLRLKPVVEYRFFFVFFFKVNQYLESSLADINYIHYHSKFFFFK